MAEIFEIIPQADKVAVYSDGKKTEYSAGTAEFSEILGAWNTTMKGAHQMPAFGVSIDKLTREEMKTGNWVEFHFIQEMCSNGLPFNGLLIAVHPEYRGANLVRNWEGLYQGRCIYVDLGEGNMSVLASALAEVQKK